MQFATHRYAEAPVAQPAGRIDHPNAAEFAGALASQPGDIGDTGGAVMLDFAAVEDEIARCSGAARAAWAGSRG